MRQKRQRKGETTSRNKRGKRRIWKNRTRNMYTRKKKKVEIKTTEVNTITVFPPQMRKKSYRSFPAVMRSFMDDFTIVYGPI